MVRRGTLCLPLAIKDRYHAHAESDTDFSAIHPFLSQYVPRAQTSRCVADIKQANAGNDFSRMNRIFRLLIICLTIATLFSPLLAYAYWLSRTYTGAYNLTSLHWYEQLALLTLLVLPLGLLKLLNIDWTSRNTPD
jgi:hypothetical protein